MITDPELCALPSGERSESGSDLASAARAADGEPARALAVAGRARAGGLVGPVDNDACPGRDRVLTLIAGVAASRGLVTEAAAAVAGIEPTHRSLGPAWRRVAALLDEHQLRAAASAYLTARTPPMARKDVLPLS